MLDVGENTDAQYDVKSAFCDCDFYVQKHPKRT